MRRRQIVNYIIFFIIIILFRLMTVPALAEIVSDSDNDGVADEDEIKIYQTDPNKADTDGDGFNDWSELNNGFSPLNRELVKLEDNDNDDDGLSDRMELNFKTNLSNPDTDGDGFNDGVEIKGGYDPLRPDKVKLIKKIEINTGQEQKLYYFLGDVRMGEFKISSGKSSMRTPKGNFKIDGKIIRAWSKKYGLWMPYWMSLKNGYFGIHELPEWPNGTKEGKNHLGLPVSHGCIRLGIGSAEFLYNWAPVGTAVKIY